jgi:hypothetical protein
MPVFTRFRGLNNQRSAEQMPAEDLVGCTNLMVNDDGALVSRPGLTRKFTGAAHSLTSFNGQLFFRTGSELVMHGATNTAVDSLLGSGRTCYAKTPSALLYSDGVSCRMLESGEAGPWGLPPPQFTVFGGVGGNVQITATYIRGRYESGAGTPVAVGTTATISIPPIAGATHKAVYMSMPGGEVLRRVAMVPISHPDFVVQPSDDGMELQTMHKTPPPPHSVSAIRNGRALIGVGAFLLYSDPFRFDLFDPIRQSIPFDSDVTMLASVSADSLIVGTRTGVFRLSGPDLDSTSLTQLSDMGAVAGAYTIVDASLFGPSHGVAVVFVSPGGLSAVTQDGSVTNLTGDRFRPGDFMSGSAGFLRQPGAHSVVFSLRH